MKELILESSKSLFGSTVRLYDNFRTTHNLPDSVVVVSAHLVSDIWYLLIWDMSNVQQISTEN